MNYKVNSHRHAELD